MKARALALKFQHQGQVRGLVKRKSLQKIEITINCYMCDLCAALHEVLFVAYTYIISIYSHFSKCTIILTLEIPLPKAIVLAVFGITSSAMSALLVRVFRRETCS